MTENLIRLSLVTGAGSRRAIRALEYFGSAESIFSAGYDLLAESGIFTPTELAKLAASNAAAAREIMRECDKEGIKIVCRGDNAFPKCLAETDDSPLLLYVKGELPDFDRSPVVCVVGPRKVSENGRRSAYAVSKRLARAGVTVVSGGAVGSDYAAHCGALDGGGKTVLVMGCGLLSGYLSENEALRHRVAENGCIISEFSPHSGASRYTFPVRNRIMSALAQCTVVVEAGVGSGALITARCAAEQGKEVFVIPGDVYKKECKGSNALLRDGARPLIDMSDIFGEYIGRFPDKIDIEKAYSKEEKNVGATAESVAGGKPVKRALSSALSDAARAVYEKLDGHKFYPDEIKDTGLTPGELLSALTELEVELLIRSVPGGCYELTD